MEDMQKDNSNFIISIALSVIFSFVIHYSFFSWIKFHPTFHAMLGICIFFLFFILFNELLRRFWQPF